MGDEGDIEWEADAYEEFQRLLGDVERGLKRNTEDRAVADGYSTITKFHVGWTRRFLRNRWVTLPDEMGDLGDAMGDLGERIGTFLKTKFLNELEEYEAGARTQMTWDCLETIFNVFNIGELHAERFETVWEVTVRGSRGVGAGVDEDRKRALAKALLEYARGGNR